MKEIFTIYHLPFTISKKIVSHKSSIVNDERGFTLVELLIAVVIIGILTTLLMANFIAVRQRARDAQRKSDIRQIQAALELYRSDWGTYPTTVSSCANQITSPDGQTVYMKRIPCDPSGSSYYVGGNYYYCVNQSGGVPCDSRYSGPGDYLIIACLENKSDSQGVTRDWGGNCPTQYFFVGTNP